jgi:hypothetical protein
MFCLFLRWFGSTSIALVFLAASVVAQDGGEVLPPPPAETKAPFHDPDHTFERAGCPQRVAWYAHPSDTSSYAGYSVGGGAACCGEARYPDEGTWGHDYQGWLIPRRIILDWWHGRKYQDGIGHYRTVPTQNLASPSTP